MADVLPQGRYETKRIETDRIALNVRVGGSGPLMLFFHGITSNSAVFEPVMDEFADRFTTIAVDQRGHGLSDKPSSGYQAKDYADDIAALIKTLDMGPAILVGHSLGSRNSVTAAARHPDLVRSVIAIDFTPYIETEVFDTLTARVNSGDQAFPDLETRGLLSFKPLPEHSRARHPHPRRKRLCQSSRWPASSRVSLGYVPDS